MASWKLGKIFDVDEEKEATINELEAKDDSESSGEEDDDDAAERAAAFNKNKKNSSNVVDINKTNSGSIRDSIRRYDEYGNFLSRSERAHAEKEHQEKVLKESSNSALNRKASGSVKFKDGEEMLLIKEIPRFTDEEKGQCFMTQANWESIDTDLEVTQKRWKNHTDGKIKFDEDNNTIRGIEDQIFRINKGKPMYKHRKSILEEVVRQKTEGEYPNWEKLREISVRSSETTRKQALELGKEDEKEKNRVWTARAASPVNTGASEKKDKAKRKSSFFGLFKKK